MQESIMTKLLMNAGKSYRTTQDIGETKWCSNSPMLRIGYLKKWFAVLARVEDRRKGFNIAWTRTILKILVRSSNPRTFRKYNQSCIARQCIVTRRFHRFFYHVGNGNNLGQRRIMVWLQEESFSKQADKLCSSPLWIRWIIKMASWETLCDLSQTRIAPYRNTWKYFQDTLFLVQLEARPTKRTCNFIKQDQTQSFSTTHCLQSSLRKRCTMKTKDQLYQRESVILRPRVVLRADSQTGSQDLLVQEARSSWEGSQQDAKGYKETRSNTADFRIPGISSSTVKLHDARRQNHVTKLIEMFEKQQHKKHFLKDMSHKQEINRFITKILEDMSSTVFETFREFCKTSTSSLLFRDGNRVSLLQLRFYFNPWLCHQEEFQSRTKARPIWKTDHVSSRRRRCTRKRDSQSTSNMEDTVERRWFGRTNIISRPCSFVLVALNENVRSARILWTITEVFSNQGFLLGLLKNPETKATVKPDAETISSWFFEIWKVMQRNAWRYCEFANKTIEQCFKSQRHAWKIINSKKKKMDQL